MIKEDMDIILLVPEKWNKTNFKKMPIELKAFFLSFCKYLRISVAIVFFLKFSIINLFCDSKSIFKSLSIGYIISERINQIKETVFEMINERDLLVSATRSILS